MVSSHMLVCIAAVLTFHMMTVDAQYSCGTPACCSCTPPPCQSYPSYPSYPQQPYYPGPIVVDSGRNNNNDGLNDLLPLFLLFGLGGNGFGGGCC